GNLLIKLLKTIRQHTAAFALLEVHQLLTESVTTFPPISQRIEKLLLKQGIRELCSTIPKRTDVSGEDGRSEPTSMAGHTERHINGVRVLVALKREWCKHQTSSAEVRQLFFGNVYSASINQLLTPNGSRWLSRVLRLHEDRLPQRAFFIQASAEIEVSMGSVLHKFDTFTTGEAVKLTRINSRLRFSCRSVSSKTVFVIAGFSAPLTTLSDLLFLFTFGDFVDDLLDVFDVGLLGLGTFSVFDVDLGILCQFATYHKFCKQAIFAQMSCHTLSSDFRVRELFVQPNPIRVECILSTVNEATECAAPGRLMFQLLRYSRYRDTCIFVMQCRGFQATECAAPGRLMFQLLRYSRYRDTCIFVMQCRGFQQLEHEAAWCSTFSCLETSQTRDSAGFQVSLSQKPNSVSSSRSEPQHDLSLADYYRRMTIVGFESQILLQMHLGATYTLLLDDQLNKFKHCQFTISENIMIFLSG
ncbi:hypothetical protein CLF_109500, partial [Clonorchis sinensis]